MFARHLQQILFEQGLLAEIVGGEHEDIRAIERLLRCVGAMAIFAAATDSDGAEVEVAIDNRSDSFRIRADAEAIYDAMVEAELLGRSR